MDTAPGGQRVTDAVGLTLFAGRFRECAARSLLLPRRNPGKRQPLWQQRQRASQLLDIARPHRSSVMVRPCANATSTTRLP